MCVASTAGYYLLTGKHGIHAQQKCVRKIEEKQLALKELKHEVTLIENDLQAWQSSSLLKEKVARQDLQLSCTHEWVYFIK
jgi:cell division protein FtsB